MEQCVNECINKKFNYSIMRRVQILGVLIIFAISFIACTKKTYQLQEEFTLGFNKSGIVKLGGREKMKIKFNKLVEESRCAPGNTCVWAGRVSIELKLDDSTALTLGLGDGTKSDGIYKGHSIQLLEVTYDKKENFGKEGNYSVKLKVDYLDR